MFIGRYYHTIEEKGRVSLPKTFRDTTQNWVITRGLDGGVFLFSQKTFQTQLQELQNRTFTKKQDRDFLRFMTNDAYSLSQDKNGRVLLPEYLRNFAHLTKEVVIVGSFNYIEIWDRGLYHTYIDSVEKTGSSLAENVQELR